MKIGDTVYITIDISPHHKLGHKQGDPFEILGIYPRIAAIRLKDKNGQFLHVSFDDVTDIKPYDIGTKVIFPWKGAAINGEITDIHNWNQKDSWQYFIFAGFVCNTVLSHNNLAIVTATQSCSGGCSNPHGISLNDLFGEDEDTPVLGSLPNEEEQDNRNRKTCWKCGGPLTEVDMLMGKTKYCKKCGV